MTVAPAKTDLAGVWSTGVHVGILGASFLLLYGQVFRTLAGNWLDHDRLDCFLILPISIYLVWLKRQQLTQLPLKPVRVWGLGLEVLAALLLVLGRISGVFVLEQFSLIAMIPGLVLLFLGQAFLRALRFPIAYLLLMMPVTEDLVAPLHWPLQLLTAQMAGPLLQGLGIPALVESQYITLPHIVLAVDKVCSGANYLLSIVAIGLPLAYLTLRNRWSRVALVCVGIAIGVVANWARIALIGAWSYWGGQVLHGPFHILQGLLVAWIGFLGLFAGAWALSKLEKPNLTRSADVSGRSPSTVIYQHDRQRVRKEWRRLSWIAAAIAGAFAVYLSSYDPGTVPLKMDLATFPSYIGDGWVGLAYEPQKPIFRLQGADNELARAYRDSEGHELQVYVAYLNNQRQGKEVVNDFTREVHRNAEIIDIEDGRGGSIRVNYGVLGNNGSNSRILFWYDINGRVIANLYEAKVATTLDALMHGRTNGALVLLVTTQVDANSARTLMEPFVSDLSKILRLYLL